MTDTSDLDHLNYAELLEERVAVKARIREILEELKITGRPDDNRYKKWVRGMLYERHELMDRLDLIKLNLARRQAEGAATSGAKGPSPSPDLVERREKLKAALAEAGPDALLLRVRLAIHHLLPENTPLDQAGLSEEDVQAVRDLSIYLRARYGSTPIKEHLHREMEA